MFKFRAHNSTHQLEWQAPKECRVYSLNNVMALTVINARASAFFTPHNEVQKQIGSVFSENKNSQHHDFVVRSSSGLQNQGSKILIVIINFKETEQKAFKFTTRLFSYQQSHEEFYLFFRKFNFCCVSPAILSTGRKMILAGR